ncbi:MAG TPA: family 1 encapsulin nanocompartment shell protein [Calidithermus sp.]|jgi:uncharacterized linocin/CFP29 family protein|nr:family 1 encapsulin nanocompartment shell protein [Calidithermus sp.]
MDILRRDAAPLTPRALQALDEAVAQAARHVLVGRRVADFDGPRGWEHQATRLGTMKPCATREGQAVVCVPDVALLAEIRAEFTLSWTALEHFERGAPALDTAPAEAAAREVALAEDRLVLYGEPVGQGFLASPKSPSVTVEDWARPGQALADVLRAVERLDGLGIGGPYELVLAPARYYAFLRGAEEGGYPTTRHLREVVAAVHRGTVLRGAGALFSTRGGDFVITVGGDLSVGYRGHDAGGVHLFCVETVAAQVVTPEAVCLLRP